MRNEFKIDNLLTSNITVTLRFYLKDSILNLGFLLSSVTTQPYLPKQVISRKFLFQQCIINRFVVKYHYILQLKENLTLEQEIKHQKLSLHKIGSVTKERIVRFNL
jgi:hypothetical protein